MNKQLLFLILFVILGLSSLSGQILDRQFNDLISKGDTVKQREFLEKWECKNQDDPELYIAYYNYYINKSRQETLVLGNKPKGDDVLQIMSMDSTQKEPVGYIYGGVSFRMDLLDKGFDWIKRGIEKYPDRLDMRLGLIYMLQQLRDYDQFASQITKAIDRSVINSNQWLWVSGVPLSDSEKMFLSSIQDYQVHLFNTGRYDLLDHMQIIAETLLKHYPNYIENLSNLSIICICRKQYAEALKWALKAERINPKDAVVLNNIAEIYARKGDIVNGIKYYELLIKVGDEPTQQYARQQIEKLKKD